MAAVHAPNSVGTPKWTKALEVKIHALGVFGKIAFRRGEVPPIHGGRALDRGGLPKAVAIAAH